MGENLINGPNISNMTILSQSPLKASHVPPSGVWTPAVTMFIRETDKLDLISQKKYYTYLATTGLTGLVRLGTNDEHLLLTRPERSTLLTPARAAVPPSYPLMAGCGAHSTHQVLELIS